MNEGMETVTTQPVAPTLPPQTTQGDMGEMRGGEIFEHETAVVIPASERSDSNQTPKDEHETSDQVRGDTLGSGDRLLSYIKEHGIEDGFDYLANGMQEPNEKVSNGSQVSKVLKGEEKKGEDVDKVDTEEKPEKTSTEKTELDKEYKDLQQRVFELTEGQENLRKELDTVNAQLRQTAEITRATVLALQVLVKKLYEEEEDKKQKQSLWVLLTRLTGFLASSLLTGPETAEKEVLKK